MRISDYVQIDNRFEKSVNLLLDLNDKKKLNCYIPTRSSIQILRGYLNEVSDFTGGRANILIGPYGKGKSHLLLILLNMLSSQKKKVEKEGVFQRIEKVDKESAEFIRKTSSSYTLLPVIMNTNSGNLSQAFTRSLTQALRTYGLDDIVPDSYFTEAVKTIKNWKEEYPDTYLLFVEKIGKGKIDSFLTRLTQGDSNALHTFRYIYPSLTSGSPFNPIIDDDPITIYRSVNKSLCEKHKYAGIYIVFDEFSKYIEGHPAEGFSADMKILQDFCELCNSSKDEQLHLTCVAHKAIRTYGDSLSKEVQNAFRGVEGRLKEILFTVSSQNNFELIADAIKKKLAFDSFQTQNSHTDLLDRSYQIPDFNSMFVKTDFDDIVGNGCYPLTPLTSLILKNLCEKIAQNERTLFTFLTGKDLRSVPTAIEEDTNRCYIGADLVYDYFIPLFEDENTGEIHEEWLKAEYALEKAKTEEERIAVKCLSAIRMIKEPDTIPANEEFISLACGIDKKQVALAIDSLTEQNVLVLKKNTATYEFQNTINAKAETVVKDYAAKYFTKVDVAAVLNDVFRNRYILPKQYNQKYTMTRYYRILFQSADTFLALSSVDYLKDENEPDGYVLLLLGAEEKEESIKKHMEELTDPELIIAIPERGLHVTDSARSYLAVNKLKKDEKFMKENEALYKKLELLSDELEDELNQKANELIASVTVLNHTYGPYPIEHGGINRAVSNICSKTYDKTPRFNHELINRHNLSAQISKARNILMDDLIHCRQMEKYENGTSAESTIYRATFMNQKEDTALIEVKEKIRDYIMDCRGKKVPFARLVKELTKPPVGMRKGVIPLFIVEQLMELEDMPVIYLGKKELAIDAPLMSNVIAKPADYALYVEEETGEKLEYIEKLEALFADYGKHCNEIESRNRLSKLTCIIQSWYRSLPQATRVFREADYSGQDMKAIDTIRKLFQAEVNPREVVFDRIPKLFKGNLTDAFLGLEKTKRELDSHIRILKSKVVSCVRAQLALSETDDFGMSLKDWYASVPETVKNTFLSSTSQRLLRAIGDLSSTDEEAIAEKLSKEAVGLYIEDWTDMTLSNFRDAFWSLQTEIDEKEVSTKEASNQKFTIATAEGVKECIYDFDPDNMSASGYFFQNALDDMLDEYGASLDTNEKVGILMSMVKKLIG